MTVPPGLLGHKAPDIALEVANQYLSGFIVHHHLLLLEHRSMATPRAYDSVDLARELAFLTSFQVWKCCRSGTMLCEPAPLSHPFLPIPGGDQSQILMEGPSL